jgi:hypothetical protein
MTELIGFDIYKTETVLINGTNYTIRVASRKDEQEYILIVSNDSSGKNQKYTIRGETAKDFKHYHGSKLKSEILQIIEIDTQNGRL